MVLEQVFSPETVILNLESTEKDELFEEMVEVLVSVQPEINREQALLALREREAKMSTGIMHGIAVPHGNCPSAKDVVGAIGISRRGIDYESLDKSPVHLVFMLLCNPDSTELHLTVLRDLAAVLQNPAVVKELMEVSTGQEAFELLGKYKENLLQ